MTTTPLTHYTYTYWKTLTTAITAGDWTTARTLAFNLPPEVVPIVISHGAQLVAVAWPNGLPDLKTAPERPTAAPEDEGDQ